MISMIISGFGTQPLRLIYIIYLIIIIYGLLYYFKKYLYYKPEAQKVLRKKTNAPKNISFLDALHFSASSLLNFAPPSNIISSERAKDIILMENLTGWLLLLLFTVLLGGLKN